MSRRLPPLNGLRAFEAAARYLSFTKAAEELHVTPAAVSQQIKTLEAYVGTPLFRRLTRALRLTEAGQAALPALQEGLDKLAEADRILRGHHDDRVLTVSVAPSFGAKWLVPRLEGFRRAYPDYDVRIDATDRRADFYEDNVDVALRYGRGHYPGLAVECLLAEAAIPVCSPVLLDGDHPLRAPRDLRHHTLLHVQWQTESDAAPSWRMWLRAAGVEDVLDADRGPRFSLESMAVQSAIDGHGVALVSGALVADDLAAGRLVRPFPKADDEATAFRYYVVYPAAYLQRPKVAAFRDWVMKEAAGPGGPTPADV
ncbi:transcriptional regulator GcvA [Arhodomonas sp. AD133]|uniref:transcriptional regulator GcvA n=1 Tax=Arhodomonas sp. AD133 TaxID=3415009 RepID=UPI003EBDE5F3